MFTDHPFWIQNSFYDVSGSRKFLEEFLQLRVLSVAFYYYFFTLGDYLSFEVMSPRLCIFPSEPGPFPSDHILFIRRYIG